MEQEANYTKDQRSAIWIYCACVLLSSLSMIFLRLPEPWGLAVTLSLGLSGVSIIRDSFGRRTGWFALAGYLLFQFAVVLVYVSIWGYKK